MKKILSIALVALVGLFLGACSDSKNKESNASVELKVGTAPNYKPFNFKQDSKLTGFDTDLIEEIAKKNGIEIVWVETNFDGLIPALKAGKIDMIASAMSATDERRQSVDFTKPYYMSKNLYLKLKNNDSLQTKNDLEGKKIGVQLGTLQENTAKAIKNAQVQSNKDLNIAVLALKNNKIDAIVADQDTAKGFLAENPELVSFYQTLKKALLKADVHHKVTKELLTLIEEDVKQNGIGQKQFLNAIKINLENILSVNGKNQGFVFTSKPPTVVLMAGLQGGGKTTSTIKLANYLKLRNKKVLVAACDLQRLAAVEQLRQLCEANEIELFFIENEKDPIRVAKEALKKAESSMVDVLLVDTAGRLAIDEALMDELRAVKDVLNPDEIFYVADAMSGQDGVKTAASFNEVLGISGVILSKFDADTKGGVALGIAKQIGIPLRFIGVGEKVADLEVFIPDRIVSRIMGEGDLATLAEKTAAIIDEKEAKKLNQKIKKGEFNFNDFLNQMESIKKLGSMKSLIGMIPCSRCLCCI